MSQWDRILGLRDAVNKQIEDIRQTGAIGSSLDAEVKLYCDGNDYQLLKQLGQELKFLFITSAAEVYPSAQAAEDAIQATDRMRVFISPSRHPKCPRCWHRCADLEGAVSGAICARCTLNVNGKGEERTYL